MLLERLIGPDEDGNELKTILKHGFRLSHKMIVRLKSHQGIHVNGSPVFTSYICHTGDHITLDIAVTEPDQSIPPEHNDLMVLYEDEYILAVYKPEGMLTHPSRTQVTGTLMGYVLGYLSKWGITTCHALNRLDRYTSGIVLFAKNAYAKALFARSLQNAAKTYIAVVHGRVISDCGIIDLPIDRLISGNIQRGVTKDGSRAITNYRLLNIIQENGSTLSVLKLEPETGRTHQLRVHCSALGHPIIGDRIYCTEDSRELSDHLGIHGQLLHAQELKFSHPVSNMEIIIKCPITRDDMKRFI